MAGMANLAVAASILLCGLSLLLAGLGAVAAKRLRSGKLAWVAIAFFGFAVQGAYLAWLAYDRRADVEAGAAGEFPTLALSSLAIVVALYFAALKR